MTKEELEKLVEDTAKIIESTFVPEYGHWKTSMEASRAILSKPGLLAEVELKHKRHKWYTSFPLRVCSHCGLRLPINDHWTKVPPCIEKKIIPLSEALKEVGK